MAHRSLERPRSHSYNARKVPRLLKGYQKSGTRLRVLVEKIELLFGDTLETKFPVHATKGPHRILSATSICINNRLAWKYISADILDIADSRPLHCRLENCRLCSGEQITSYCMDDQTNYSDL